MGKEGSGIDWEPGVSRCKPPHLKWISNEILLYSTGNYSQSPRIEHDGRSYEKNNVYADTSMTGSLCCTQEIGTKLCINYNFKKFRNLQNIIILKKVIDVMCPPYLHISHQYDFQKMDHWDGNTLPLT